MRRRVPRQLARLSVAARASPQPARARPRAGPACVGAGGDGAGEPAPQGCCEPSGDSGGCPPHVHPAELRSGWFPPRGPRPQPGGLRPPAPQASRC